MRLPMPIALLVIVLGATAAAQPNSQKMVQTSIEVIGAVSNGNNHVDFVRQANGFFLDGTHIVTNMACCGKTDKGQQIIPLAAGGKDDMAPGKEVWSDRDTGLIILELTKALSHPGITISPEKLQQGDEPVYLVQYDKQGDGLPKYQVTEGKLTGKGKLDGKDILYTTTLQVSDDNKGGAIYDACANVIGIHLGMQKGEEFAVVIDPLIDTMKSAGLSPGVTDQPCGAGGGSTTSGGGGGGGGSGGGGPGKGPDKGQSAPESGLRLPQGQEWIPVIIVVGLLVLAIRPARKKMAQVVTGHHAVPQPAPYPMPGPMQAGAGMEPLPYMASGQAPYASPGQAPYIMPGPAAGAGKPVLRGVTGEYAGVTFPLESGSSTLGRDPQASNLVFSADATSISKRHCSVRWDAGRAVFLLEDHGSTNGTFLSSGERLAPSLLRELHPGDRFYIGDLRNQFEVGLEP